MSCAAGSKHGPSTTPTTPESPVNTATNQPSADAGQATPDDRSETRRWREAFGDPGLAWFADGVSWDDAQARHARQLRDGVVDRSEVRRWREAFGDRGLVWLADGVSWEDAEVRFARELREAAAADVQARNDRLFALEVRVDAAEKATGELAPVGFSAAGESPDWEQSRGFAGNFRIGEPRTTAARSRSS